jgi:UDP-GlcNAc:undecaprenyl-phosphate/decaprenyl-phosphate GlcNAc-1-phosphate transferase
MIYFSTLLLSIFATVALIPAFSRLAIRYHVGLDVPDARKVHRQPIPRVGGIAITLAVYASAALWVPEDHFLKAYLIASAFLVLFGVIDDLKGLDFRVKFLSQVIAALIMILYGGVKIKSVGALLPSGYVLPDAVSIPLTLVAIVGVTNAINLSDGLDGLAGGVSLLSFCCLGYLAYLEGNLMLCLLALALGGSIFGFLRYNTYPAQLFMGDTGSQFLGFSAASVSLALTQGKTTLSPLLPLLILGLPIIDTLAVMAQRLAEKKPLFSPDKNHFHHKLIRLGFIHVESVLLIYMLQAGLVAAALLLRFQSEWMLLSGYLMLAALILIGFHRAERAHWTIPRYDFLDRVVKGRLKKMRDEAVFIHVTFRVVEYGIPLLLLATCIVPAEIPSYFSLLAAVFLFVMLLVWKFRNRWMRGCLMTVLYLFIPLVVFMSVDQTNGMIPGPFLRLYNLSYPILVFFVVFTLKLTRRQNGFKTTPMDFLIIFIALVLPELLRDYVEVKDLRAVAAKTVMFFFSFEVIMGELRGKLNNLALASIPPLAFVIVRGLCRI